jgi:ADP-ribose pyrophosphatase YjhB (NUDIX family)
MPEDPKDAAMKELEEETNLKPISYKKILENKEIFDESTGHFGYVFIHFVDKDAEPKYNEEINPEESGFKTPEEILEIFEKEKFTPPSKKVLEEFLKEYSTNNDLRKFYTNSIYA